MRVRQIWLKVWRSLSGRNHLKMSPKIPKINCRTFRLIVSPKVVNLLLWLTLIRTLNNLNRIKVWWSKETTTIRVANWAGVSDERALLAKIYSKAPPSRLWRNLYQENKAYRLPNETIRLDRVSDRKKFSGWGESSRQVESQVGVT